MQEVALQGNKILNKDAKQEVEKCVQSFGKLRSELLKH